MLIDSGADISAISTDYEEEITIQNKNIPSLPLSGLSIHNAVGNKPTKVSRQILVPIEINNITIHSTFIVVPNLNDNEIIGNDFLESNKTAIDFNTRTFTITTNGIEKAISFKNKQNRSSAQLRTVHTRLLKDPATHYPPYILPAKEQEYLDNLIEQFPEVFSNRPGKVKGYKCKIALKSVVAINIGEDNDQRTNDRIKHRHITNWVLEVNKQIAFWSTHNQENWNEPAD